MAFATRSDLMARSNARRLAQLAVPADMPMVPDEALRVAIDGGSLAGYTPAEQVALTQALAAIDDALADADALIVSYGIAAAVQTPLLARMASTVALYYLQGAERMTEDVRMAYEDVIGKLKAHARGEMNLVPLVPSDPPLLEDLAVIESNAARYGGSATPGADW